MPEETPGGGRPAGRGRIPRPAGPAAGAVALCLLLAGCGQVGGAGASDPPATPSTASSPDGPSDRSSTSGSTKGGAASPSSSRDAAARPAAPSRLAIPEIDLDERLIDLGLAGDGAMEVPEDPDRAGWFTGGGRPGGPGPTVVAGHVDSTEGPAVFGELGELDDGDEVVLEGTDGGRTTYRVDRLEDYPKGAFPTEEVFGATAGDELRLITCSGEWDSVGETYTDNTVAYATAVDGG